MEKIIFAVLFLCVGMSHASSMYDDQYIQRRITEDTMNTCEQQLADILEKINQAKIGGDDDSIAYYVWYYQQLEQQCHSEQL